LEKPRTKLETKQKKTIIKRREKPHMNSKEDKKIQTPSSTIHQKED
jgi:hypothetical protein